MEYKKLQKEESTFDIVVTDYVEQKIRHLCNKIYNIEWSGILFYKYEGSYQNNDLKIICEDILPMDIGNSTYTDFEMSPDVIAYMTENDLLECECGLVHSHHNMATFFSGTDLSTLEKEGNDRNHFVSLIVNNEGKYTAAITRKVLVEENADQKISYRTFNDEEVFLDGRSCRREYYIIKYNMLNIIKKEPDYSFNDVDSRLAEIRKAKEAKKEKEKKDIVVADTKKHNTLGLFDYDRDFNYTDYSTDFYKKDFYTKDRSYFDFKSMRSGNDVERAKLIMAQILDGSITITDASDIDFNELIERIVPVYDEVFDGNYYKFRLWIETFSEFLLFELHDDMAEDVYSEIIKITDELPENEYTSIIRETLLNYMEEYE